MKEISLRAISFLQVEIVIVVTRCLQYTFCAGDISDNRKTLGNENHRVIHNRSGVRVKKKCKDTRINAARVRVYRRLSFVERPKIP